MKFTTLLVFLTAALVAHGAAPTSPPAVPTAAPVKRAPGELAPEQLAFWNKLRAHVGKTYPGRLDDATAYYQNRLAGQTIIVHVREASDDRMHIAMHVGDNRSRNWILTKTGGTLRLKHDHRDASGKVEAITEYGGDAPSPGLATRQTFPSDAHTARIMPDRLDNFWFIDFMSYTTLAYGVHWPKVGHSLLIVFDLTKPLPAPPAPWGY